MDEIVAAVLSAVPAIAANTVTEGVKDAYSALKALIQRKWGEKGEVTKSLETLEQDPNSQEQVLNFRRQAEASELHRDPDIQSATQHLIDALAGAPPPTLQPNVTFNHSGGTLKNSIGAIGVSNAPITIG